MWIHFFLRAFQATKQNSALFNSGSGRRACPRFSPFGVSVRRVQPERKTALVFFTNGDHGHQLYSGVFVNYSPKIQLHSIGSENWSNRYVSVQVTDKDISVGLPTAQKNRMIVRSISMRRSLAWQEAFAIGLSLGSKLRTRAGASPPSRPERLGDLCGFISS